MQSYYFELYYYYKKKKKQTNKSRYQAQFFSTSIDADKRAFGHVIKTADAPALVLSLEELQAHLEAVLHQAVVAHLRITAAPLVTLVYPEWDKAKT